MYTLVYGISVTILAIEIIVYTVYVLVSMISAIEILVCTEYVMVSMVLGHRDISLQGVCYCLYDFGGMERVSSIDIREYIECSLARPACLVLVE